MQCMAYWGRVYTDEPQKIQEVYVNNECNYREHREPAGRFDD